MKHQEEHASARLPLHASWARRRKSSEPAAASGRPLASRPASAGGGECSRALADSCSFCRSTLVRDGDALRRVGVSAELIDDHSPLQLGAHVAGIGVVGMDPIGAAILG